MCLDYFEETAVKDVTKFEYTPLDPANKDAVGIKIPIYNCPSVALRDRFRTQRTMLPT